MKRYYYTYLIFLTEGSLFGHVYIGRRISTRPPNEDVKYKGSGKIIKDYYKKYPNGYIKLILAEFENVDQLAIGERFAISIFNKEYIKGFNNCINIQPGGYHPYDNPKIKELISEKLSNSLKEYFKSHKPHESVWKGKHLPEEMKQAVSIGMKRRWQDEEYRKSQCESMKGHKPWNKGKHYKSPKISESLKGRTAWNKGMKMKKEDHPLYGKHKVYDNDEHTSWHWEKKNI